MANLLSMPTGDYRAFVIKEKKLHLQVVDQARPDAIISSFTPIIGRPRIFEEEILTPACKGEPPGEECSRLSPPVLHFCETLIGRQDARGHSRKTCPSLQHH